MLPFTLASGGLRDRLVADVMTGDKTATTSLRASYDVEGEPLPEPGLYRLLDRDDRPIGVVEVTAVDIRRLGEVDDAVAHTEGEGFADVAAWRRSQEEFWRSGGEVAAARAHFGSYDLDDDVMRHITTGPLDRAASDAMLERIRLAHDTEGFGLSAVRRLDDGAFLGFTGLNRHRWYPDDVEIGWRLNRDAWGHGYATEAARAWIRRAFGLLGLPRLISITVPENERSIAVMRRLGFTVLEHARHDSLDVVVYARSAHCNHRRPVGRCNAVAIRRSTSAG